MTSNRRPWKNGVRQTSVKGEYEVRPVWRDASGTRRDTIRRVVARTAHEAMAEKERLEHELRGVAAAAGLSVKDALDKLLEQPRAFATTQSWTSHAKRISEAFKERTLSSVTAQEWRKYLADLPVSDNTAKCVRTVLLRMYDVAIDSGNWVGANPIRDVKRRVTPQTPAAALAELVNPKRRAMRPGEAAAVLAELDANLRPLATIQLMLGCRFSEVSALTWASVDMTTGVVHIFRGQVRGRVGPVKTGDMRHAELPPEGLAVLRAWRERMETERWPGWEELVFPRPPTPARRLHHFLDASVVGKAVREAQQRAGVSLASRTHAWRHTHITSKAAERRGAEQRARTMEAVGHANDRQHDQYIDTSLAPAEPLAAVGTFVEAIVGAWRKH